MTFSTRPLARALIACAATALALSACSGKGSIEKPTTPTPSVSASASESAEATPAPGEWTLEDLKVGAKVPKEDLERLFPKWEVPEPPATLTEFSEQGAIEAATYFDRIVDLALQERDPGLLNEIDSEICQNCADVRDAIANAKKQPPFSTQPELGEFHPTKEPEGHPAYSIEITRTSPLIVEIDPATMTILEIKQDRKKTTHTVVGYRDGQWMPVMLKLDKRLF